MKYLLLLLLLPFVAFMKIKIFITYIHDGKEKDDELLVQFKMFFNLIKYKITVPVLAIDDESASIVYKEKRQSAMGEKEISDKFTFQRFIDDMIHFERFLKHVIGFHTIIRKFMQKVSVNEFYWKTLIGAGDAAITGSTSGLLWGIKGNIIGLMSHYLKIKESPNIFVEPEFQQLLLKTSFKCMVSFRIGHAILAGIKVLRHWKKGRTLFKVNSEARRDMNV